MKNKKNNINTIVPELVADFMSAESDTKRDEIFNCIISQCHNLLNYIINQTKFQPPMTYDELYTESLYWLYFYMKLYNKNNDKGCKLSTYLTFNISHRLQAYVYDNNRLIRINHGAYAEMKRKNNTEKYNYKFCDISKVECEDDISIEDNYCDKETIEEEFKYVMKFYDKLTKRQQFIINEHIFKNKSFTQIKNENNLTRQNVSDLYNRTIKKLKKMIKENEEA